MPTPTHTPFAARLARLSASRGSVVCAGLDPRIEWIPVDCQPLIGRGKPNDRDFAAAAFEKFSVAVLDELAEVAVVVKPQAAFFEQYHAPGHAAYIAVCQAARERGMLVIADVKRGDIGTTAEAYARAWLGCPPGGTPVADAVTVNPYMGRDATDPFVAEAARTGGAAFILVKTSNASSADYQDQRLATGLTLAETVADNVEQQALAHAHGARYGVLGAVVGATHRDVLLGMRQRMPHCILLLPGYGAQGGGAADCADAFDANGGGAVVSASRSLTFPWDVKQPAPADWRRLVREAGVAMRDALRRVADRT